MGVDAPHHMGEYLLFSRQGLGGVVVNFYSLNLGVWSLEEKKVSQVGACVRVLRKG